MAVYTQWMRGFMVRTACLGVVFGILLGGTLAMKPHPAPASRPVAAASAEPDRIVRPGLVPHVYRTAPKPAPAPAKPKPSSGVLASATTAAPHAIYNWLRAEDGALSVPVGVYNDPTGEAVVPSGEAVLDLAMREVPWYFDGHNPGVFTPLLGEGVGSLFDYWDGSGREHRFRIVAVRTWYRSSGEPPPVTPLVVAQFQTCKVADGSIDYIYDAVAA